MYAVLLDACVLVPNALCDTLLRLAEAGFYRPLWSERILDETKYAILKAHPDLDEPRIDARIAAMSGAFDDAMVIGWEQTCAGLDLPDDNDRHVLAAAIKGGAQSLVTFNLKDFPDHSLAATDVEVVHPDEFLLDQLDLFPGLALQVITEQAADLNDPPSDVAGVLNRLERCGVPRFADEVRLLVTAS
jgi:predicted nucleic acid-binding protein